MDTGIMADNMDVRNHSMSQKYVSYDENMHVSEKKLDRS